MAFPNIVSVTSTSFAVASTTHNVNMPASVTAGDLLLVFLAINNNGTSANPSGWFSKGIIYAPDTGPPYTCNIGWWAKRADGTEGGTTVNFQTGSSQTGAAQCWRITNGDTQTLAAWVNGTSANPNPASGNSGGAGIDSLWIVALVIDNDSAGTVTSYPTNYSLNQTETNSVGGSATDPTLAVCARKIAAASEDPGTFTVASAAYAALTIVVQPYISSPPYQRNTPRIWRLS